MTFPAMTEDKEVRGRIILGSGRSGTTWVQDCLADANRLRPIFEPLHEGESDIGSRLAYRMLVPGERNEELARYFNELSQGHIYNLWIDYRARRRSLFPHHRKLLTMDGFQRWRRTWKRHLNDRKRLSGGIKHRKTLIKCIRANLMAGWLSNDMRFRTIFLVRHPCGCVESQSRIGAGWNPKPTIERYRSDKQLHETTDGIYLPLLHSSLTRLQALTLIWVIENQGPVARASTEGYSVFYYEYLRNRSPVAWPRICAALGLDAIPGTQLLDAPSQQTYGNLARVGLNASEPRWRQTFTIDQLREIQAILDRTGCDLYDVSSCEPIAG